MSIPLDRPPAVGAEPELLALQKWEAFASWFLNHTRRWPKAARFTLTQRLENHALDVTELLVQARYDPRLRKRLLHDINLRLERMRFLCRIARDARARDMPRSPGSSARSGSNSRQGRRCSPRVAHVSW